jgi:predicted dehydrogenase
LSYTTIVNTSSIPPRPETPAGEGASEPYRRWFSGPAEHEECWGRLLEGDYPSVFLTTPPAITWKLLMQLIATETRFVLAEKPWFPDLETASRVIPHLRGAVPRIRFLDHYLYRPGVRWLQGQNLPMLLGGHARALTAWILETSDLASPAMTVGVLKDTLIHLVSIVRAIFPGCGFNVQRVRAGQYRGAPPGCDTFVQVQALVDAEEPVTVTLTAAKAHPPVDGPSKAVVIDGPGAALKLDLDRETVFLASPSIRTLYSQGRDEDAYTHILRRLDGEDHSLGMDAEEALAIHRILHAVRERFPRPMPSYDRDQRLISRTPF